MSSPSSDSRPPALVVAAALTSVEGVLTIVYGVSIALHAHLDRAVMGASTTFFLVAYGAALVLCGWGLYTVRSWSRGPVLFFQLIWLGLAWSFRSGDTWPISVALAVAAVAVLVTLLHPTSLDVLNRAAERGADDD